MPEGPYVQPRPPKRPLKIYAFDPMLGRSPRTRITVSVSNEKLAPGPRGERIHVVDYDSTNDRYYEPVDLEDASIVMQDGLDPSASDPRFHQQMVYAVASQVLENFDFALGRRIKFRKNRPLRIFPHAFEAANAFYDPKLNALLFGYFRADEKNPGPNIPGQTVFTCLSQDIVAHETTHALVHRLRRFFFEPSNRDVAAFHEGFSDIVAILQHFSFPGIVRDVLAENRGDLRAASPLVELAAQFGHAQGQGHALRTAIDHPDPQMYQRVDEPHARGAILVGAVFDAFFTTYQKRIADLLRIATGGTGLLPAGDIHPDLVNRVAGEAAKTAQQVLTMCIRAFDYLPPVDIRFGDFLRALVTADFELAPSDEAGMRAAMIEAFRVRGIYADGVASLAEESLLWDERPGLAKFPVTLLNSLIPGASELASRGMHAVGKNTVDQIQIGPIGTPAPPKRPRRAEKTDDDESDIEATLSRQLHRYAVDNAAALGLDSTRTIAVEGFHPSFRVAPDGGLKIELVAQFVQKDAKSEGIFGGIPFRGGVTVIAAADGTVRYVISKPLSAERRDRLGAFVLGCDARDPIHPWADDAYLAERMALRMNFASLHEGRTR